MSEETKNESPSVATDAPKEQQEAQGPDPKAILEALKVVKDPEIPVNIVDLGLIYNLHTEPSGHVDIEMTLTAIGCPVQDMIKADVELAAMRVPGVKSVNVDFVWSPPWTPARMTEEGKKQLRMLGFNV